MTRSWLAYLPYHFAADLLAHPGTTPVGRVQYFQAVALFVDISGFTTMSEALGRAGKAGTEELSQILNSYFAPMITLIESYGGIIGKFAGDALTVLFPYRTRTRRVTARRAIQCALDMQAQMPSYVGIQTSVGNFSLGLRAGLGQGTVLSTTIGTPAIRLEYLLAGSAIDRCAEAKQHAPEGGVVITDDLLALAGAAESRPITPGFTQILHLERRPTHAPLPLLPAPNPEIVTLIGSYLHPVIARRLAAEQRSFVDEHREVSIVFVQFNGFDYQSSTEIARLHTYLTEVIQIVHRYDGYLRQVDIGDKGSLYIVLFGAPLTHEDDADRALLCALELRVAAEAFGVTTATGINTGHVYCGLIGSLTRREYAAIGDAVNLTVRLMSAAQPGQILVSDTTRHEATESFIWTQLAPIQVKGKDTPISIAALERLQPRFGTRPQVPVFALPMVGRQHELEYSKQLLEHARHGQGQILGITAEAGMGKSRLVTEIIRHTLSQGVACYTSECLSYGTSTSYLVWQHLLHALFGLVPSMSTDEQLAHLHEQVAEIDPLFVERLPVLSTALNLPIPENELTRAMDAKLRKASLEALLVDCVRFWAKRTPLVLVLEDGHWIDALSRDLLETIAQSIVDSPILIVITYRLHDRELAENTGPTARFAQLPHFHELRLVEFTAAEAEHLIELKLTQLFGQQGSVPPELLERITERAQGNPFYIDELVNLIHDRGIDPRDLSALAAIELPDSLQRLIISRIDQLEEGPKTALKVGSIIGRLFKAHWLWRVYPQLGSADQVHAYLRELSRTELLQLERTEPELEYLFKHLITREVAYESLAIATRTALHEQIGHFVEAAYSGELERWLDVLAYHYGHSTNQNKQRLYFRKAADAAQAAYANEVAIEYYRRLLPLLTGVEQVEVWLSLCQVQQHTGQWTEAEASARQALALAEQLDSQELMARSLRVLGIVCQLTGLYDQALTYLEQARDQFTALGNQRELGATIGDIAIVKYHQGDYPQALMFQQQRLQVATELNDRLEMSQTLNQIGLIYLDQGNDQVAVTWFERGLMVASEPNTQVIRSKLIGNTGGAYRNLGDYSRAFTHLYQYVEMASRLGYQFGLSTGLGNLGYLYADLGMYPNAIACLRRCLAITTESHDRRAAAWALGQLALFHSEQGLYQEAGPLFARSIALFRKIEVPYFLAVYLHDQADWYARQQQFLDAQRSNDESLQIAVQLGISEIRFKAEVLSIRLQAMLGDVDREVAIDQLEQLRRQWPEEVNQTAIAYALWQLAPERQDYQRDAAKHYRALYGRTPNIEYHRRYEELTGEQLPPPTPFPDPPPLVTRTPIDMEVLLARVDRLISES